MTFELWVPALAGVVYLSLLFGVAYLADRGWVSERLVKHPLTYTLSLGVFASAWAVYGVVALAWELGHGYLAFYGGTAALFMFAPLLLVPLARLCKTYQLSSLADLFTFRYRSPAIGTSVTLFMLISILPLLALQIKAVTDTLHILEGHSALMPEQTWAQDSVAAVFCVVITGFTILFGTREGQHRGVVVAMAFETLVKMAIFIAIGLVSVYTVFDGWQDMEQWLGLNPQHVAALAAPMDDNVSRTLLLVYFAAAISMPHLFQMAIAERPDGRALRIASFAAPLMMLFMALPVLPILWAGLKLESPVPASYFTLSIGQRLESPTLTLLAFLAGLSAASGAMVTITLALASMCLNHLVLPVYPLSVGHNLYRQLRWIRRVLIVLILAASYLTHSMMSDRIDMASLGMAAFIGTLQFLPGIIGVLYWPSANRRGVVAGLTGGFGVWLLTEAMPAISPDGALWLMDWLGDLVGGENIWNVTVVSSLGVNAALLVLVSLFSRSTKDERDTAELCSIDELSRPSRRQLALQSAHEFVDALTEALGPEVAEREVQRALKDLGLGLDERRPYALRRLRDRIEANLSGLMGPTVAQDIVSKQLAYTEESAQSDSEDIYLIESRLENYRQHLTGLAAELDSLRRFHRQTLQELPVGVCALGDDGEVLMWNQEMERMTSIPGRLVLGAHLAALAEPWRGLLTQFVASDAKSLHKQRVGGDESVRWLSLYRATQASQGDSIQDAELVVVQDVTETQLLEQELMHAERLASIGRLAAGVAHEIGNPVTGIACLAQNLKYDTDQPEILDTAEEILRQTQRVTRIVQSLVSFAHGGRAGETMEFGAVDVHQCAEEAMQLLRLNKAVKSVVYENRCPEGMIVLGDGQRLLQVLINLLSNARDASPEDSLITVDAHYAATEVVVDVTDQGSGIPKEYLDKIFEPFFTTKDPGQGTGLGLSLVYSIVDEHGGAVQIISPVDELRGVGTRVSLRLKAYLADD